MTLRTLALAAAGCTLIATSMGSCYVMVLAEQAPPVLFAAFFGGLLVGGGSLALATFRLWNRGAQNAWPSIAHSTILFLVGMVLTLGVSASSYFMGDSKLGWMPVVALFVCVEFTVGAAILLAWAIRVDSSGRCPMARDVPTCSTTPLLASARRAPTSTRAVELFIVVGVRVMRRRAGAR